MTDTSAVNNIDRVTRSNSTSSSTSTSSDLSKQKTMDKICSMLKQLQQTVENNQKTSNEKFSSLDTKMSSQNDIWKSELNSILANHLRESNNKYVKLTEKVSDIHKSVNDKFENLERQNRLNDILVRGVPMMDKENMYSLFDKMAKVLKFPYEKLYVLSSIFRLRNNSNSSSSNSTQPPPILIKFTTPIVKRIFFSQYMKFKGLKLNDIGFESTDRIYFTDNLTKCNSSLQKKATELKAMKLIDKIQIRNGLVYIKTFDSSSTYTKISSIQDFIIIWTFDNIGFAKVLVDFCHYMEAIEEAIYYIQIQHRSNERCTVG